MNKKLALFALPFLTLTACGGVDNSMFNKSFTYKNDVYFNFDSQANGFNKTFASIISEQITNNNVNWDASGLVIDNLFSKEIIPFRECESLSKLSEATKRIGTDYFNELYKGGFSIKTSDVDSKTVEITLGNEIAHLSMEQYDKSIDAKEALYFTLKDKETYVGFLTVASAYSGAGVFNGKFTCIEIDYKNTSSCINFTVMFKEPIKNGTEAHDKLSYSVFAKINN